MKIDFTKKIIVVTGGTRGIGKSIVEHFQECNAEIIATGTGNNFDKIKSNSKYDNICYKSLDLSSEASCSSFLDFLKKQKKIDVLINNAGINNINTISNIDENDWDLINRINLRGPFILTKNISNIMKDQGSGRIVNIASVFGVVSKIKRAAYSTTKSGLIGFTKAVALDLAPHNILVNSISPGFVDTDLTRKVLGENGIKEIIETIPQQRLAKVEEVARTVLFLSSDLNTYITGQNIIVDGGFTSA